MAYFLYACQDIEDRDRAAQIRREQLHEHLAHVEANIESFAVAGPNRDADGAYRSSTFVVRASSLPQADALMARDPYVVAGLYREFHGVEFMPVAGAWVGGVNWK